MNTRCASELLYDSEVALRLVDSAIEDIRKGDAIAAASSTDAAAANQLSSPEGPSPLIARTHAEVVGMLGSVRETRAALERSASAEQVDFAASVLAKMEGRLACLAARLGQSGSESI